MRFKFILIVSLVLTACSEKYNYSKKIDDDSGSKLVVEENFFGSFTISVISKSGSKLELATANKKNEFHINPDSNLIAIIESKNPVREDFSILRVMKYNSDFNKTWNARGLDYYKETKVNNAGEKEEKNYYRGFTCKLSGLGWTAPTTLRVNIDCPYYISEYDMDSFSFGNSEDAKEYKNNFKDGDYEINFDEYNKIKNFKYLAVDDKK